MMSQAVFHFHAELNDFLAAAGRHQAVPFPLNGPTAVKHPIEALGVPHTEVDLILANDEPVEFDYLVRPADRLDVYPAHARPDVATRPLLRPPLPDRPPFVTDVHLGQLATYLRLLGFDTLYRNDFEDEEMARIAHEQSRVLLTRDRRLLMRKIVVHGYCLRTRDSREQILAVLSRFRLAGRLAPWERCLRCNGRLRPVAKEAIADRLEPKTRQYYDDFRECDACGQIYWQGSHFEPLQAFIAEIRRATAGAAE
jgi:hypothetical protein